MLVISLEYLRIKQHIKISLPFLKTENELEAVGLSLGMNGYKEEVIEELTKTINILYGHFGSNYQLGSYINSYINS